MPVKNLERLKRRLAALPTQPKDPLLGSLIDSADDLMTLQQSLVRKDTGALVASIRKEAGPTELSVLVKAGGPLTTRPVRKGASASYDYALAEEFGTDREAGQPFFYPAYRARKKSIRARLSRAATKAIKALAESQ